MSEKREITILQYFIKCNRCGYIEDFIVNNNNATVLLFCPNCDGSDRIYRINVKECDNEVRE